MTQEPHPKPRHPDIRFLLQRHSCSPHIEVPSSPFASEGEEGTAITEQKQRSPVRRAAAATDMTRALCIAANIGQRFPPAAWPLIPRSRTGRSGRPPEPSATEPAHTLSPHRNAIPHRLPARPAAGRSTPTGTAAPGTPGGKLARDSSQRQHIPHLFFTTASQVEQPSRANHPPRPLARRPPALLPIPQRPLR